MTEAQRTQGIDSIIWSQLVIWTPGCDYHSNKHRGVRGGGGEGKEGKGGRANKRGRRTFLNVEYCNLKFEKETWASNYNNVKVL